MMGLFFRMGFIMKEKIQISFSGGRTSAYMTKMLLDHWSDKYDFIVTFANTGLEHEKTLEFINNCDKYFGFNTVWLEAVVNHGERIGTSFKVVDFKTASRNGEPFEEVIKKYGIPNQAYPHCTRELKLSVMRSYLLSLRINHTDIKTAIGIREDETRRVSKQQDVNNIIYPLIDDFPVDKQDVIQWWSKQDFDLGIPEYLGNCVGCWKKSFKKQFKTLNELPNALDFYRRMEEKYPQVGNKPPHWQDIFKPVYEQVFDEDGDLIDLRQIGEKFIKKVWVEYPDRVFFRGNISTESLLGQYRLNQDFEQLDMFLDGGCSESCEVYATE